MGEYVVVGGYRGKRPDDRWWEVEDPAHRAACLIDTVREIEHRQSGIADGHRRHARMILGYVPQGMEWQQYGTQRPEVQATRNVIRSVVDTATALIARAMPKATVVTDGADWDTQRRAEDLDRFLVGMYSRGGVYPVAQRVFWDSAAFGTGSIRLQEYREGDDFWVAAERCAPTDVVVDEDECPEWPLPRCRYHRRLRDPEWVIRRFRLDGYEAEKVRGAAGRDPTYWPGGLTVPKGKVVVIEGWCRAERGVGGEVGCYSAAVEGCELAYRSWPYDWFPFVDLYWSPPVAGFYGDGVAYRQFGRQRRINYLYRWIQRCQDLIASPRIWVNGVAGPLKTQLSNEIGEIVAVQGKVEFQSPQAVNAEIYNWLDALERGGFEDEGISQASAANRLPPGIESAPAQREYSFKEGQRFAPVSQRFEDAVAREYAYRVLAMCKEAYDGGTQVTVPWADRHLSQVITWEDVELERDRYQIRAEASSLEALNPAGRLQAAIELSQTGWLTPEEGRALLGHPDLESADREGTASIDEARWVSARLLRGEAIALDPYSDFATHHRVVVAAYRNARRGGAPRRVMGALTSYLRALDAKMREQEQAAMAAQAGMAGMPPGAAPPDAGMPMPGGPTPALAPGAAAGAIPFTGS